MSERLNTAVNSSAGTAGAIWTVTLAAVSRTQDHITWALGIAGMVGGLFVVAYTIRNLKRQEQKAIAEAKAAEALARKLDAERDLANAERKQIEE